MGTEIVKVIDKHYKGYFTVLDYHVSHCKLLIRCTTTISDTEWENLDIRFEGVAYFELSTGLDDIHIKNGGEEDWEYIASRYDKEIYREYHQLYKITSQGKTFYVLALGIVIGTNNFFPLSSPIIKD